MTPTNFHTTETELRTLDVTRLWSLERLGAPRLSPDGRHVAFSVTRFPFDDNKSITDLYLASLDDGDLASTGLASTEEGPRRLTWHQGSDRGHVWSRDGKYVVFVSQRKDGKEKKELAQLYRLPLAGGEAEPLTRLPVAVRDPRCFPDGRVAFVAFTWPDLNDDFEAVAERVQEQKDDKTKAKVSDRRLLRYWDQYRTDGRVPHVFVLDPNDRDEDGMPRVRDLMPAFDNLMHFMSFDYDLAPGGDEIAFASNATAPPWHELSFEVHLLDVAKGDIQRLAKPLGARDLSPCYTPDGRYLLFGRRPRIDFSADFVRLMRFDRRRGAGDPEAAVELAPDWDASPNAWTATPDGGHVLVHAHWRGRQPLFVVPIDGGEPRRLTEDGSASSVDAGGGGRLVYLRDALTQPAEIYTRHLSDDAEQRLTRFNDDRIAGLDWPEVEDVTFEGAGGDAVQMWVLRPPGPKPEAGWPLVVTVHGGPHSSWLDAFHYRWSMSLLASAGYLVAAVNFHGSTGFGQPFASSLVGDQAEKPFQDVMQATDLLIERGDVDAERMAVAGGSFGGYMVAWAIGHTDRYAAAVCHAGVYDLMSQFASDYTWSREHAYGGAPWSDPQQLDRMSPSRFAADFKTPTLVLHGELDYRVPVTQGINFYHVLQGKGVESRIVVFPNENHWITRPQAAEVWWNEVLGWLGRHLGKGE